MQYVLHLTERCNFRCDYCGVVKGSESMDFSIAREVVDMAFEDALQRNRPTCCLSFYGGEPLLERALIERIVDCAERRFAGSPCQIHFRMTTNGAFLDKGFARYAREHAFRLALSIDGTRKAHDLHRRDESGAPTHALAVSAAKAALCELPETPAMATICPSTAPMLVESVRYLRELGFRRIVTTPDFSVDWTREQVDALAEQYRLLADWYAARLLAGDQVQLPIFDNKLINRFTPTIGREKCIPGQSRISIAPDGSIYPCTQFVRYPELCIGERGSIHKDRLLAVREQAAMSMPECEGCALLTRCDHHCGCKCLSSTGHLSRVSPTVCAHERALIPIADALGERILT